jgi:hypothetical protein
MLMPLVIGMPVVVVNVIIQVIVVARVVRYLARKFAANTAETANVREHGILVSVAILLFSGHLAQIGVWATVFRALGEFDGFATAFYHSTVNFTTLGYGDIVMSERWRLLGALEAGNGVMMFGASTALFFAVLTKLLNRRIKMIQKAGH